MFASKKLSLNEWKNWAIGLVGNTMSSIDQATSRWFWSLISDLPRDYFAKTFDQVNYLDKRVWEGMFRLRIDDIKKQLELGMSESVLETNLVKLQGLIGKYSLSPAVYEDGLKELENFTSNLPNSDDYLKTLVKVKNEFREELKSQPVLLKECIESEVNLERKEGAYYKSLLDDRSLKNTSPERVISESPILDKAAVSKRGNNNYKLRNISKLLFSNPGQALTLFLAAQSAFASAANIQMSNSTGLAIGNDTLSFDNNLSNLSEFEGRINENVSLHSISKSGNFRNSNKVRKEIEVVERDLDGGFTEIRDEFKDLRDTAELVEVLTYVKSQRSKRAANELDSEMETVAEDPLETIDGLDKRVKELEGEIQKLKNSTSSSVKGYKDQIASFEEQKMNLERSFNDMKRQSNQTLSEKASEIKGLSVMVKKLREQVEDLNKKIQENERKYLYVECARDIEAGKFRDAEEKLRQINDDTKIAYIVDRVYKNNSEGRFSLLLEFGKSLRSIHLTFSVCKFLDHGMRVSNSSDVLEVIELANAVKSEVINQVNVSCGTKKEASDLLNNLKDRIKNMAVEVLSGAMQENKYNQDNTSVVTISNAVYLLESRLFLSTVKDVIDKVYGKVDIGEVLKSATINTYIKQNISGSIAIFEKMKKEGHLNSSASLRLAGCIRVIVMQPNYENVDSEARDNLERLKNELPSSISAIAFASEVCIKSAKYDEYLYAASDVLNYDSDRRTVFTWVPKNRVANGHWALSYYQNGSFAIKNIQHNEYLFASGFTYGKYSCTEDVEFTKVLRARTRVCLHDRYRVFTWTKGIEVNNGYWEFLHDPVNEGLVKIRNVFHNNYLFSSDVRYDRDRRMVLASDGVRHSRDLWKFEDCEDWRRRRDVKEVQDVRNSTEESLQENINPSTQISDITLERVKITDKNISFTGR